MKKLVALDDSSVQRIVNMLKDRNSTIKYDDVDMEKITKYHNIGATVVLIKAVSDVLGGGIGDTKHLKDEMSKLFVKESNVCDFKQEGRCTRFGIDQKCNADNCHLDELAKEEMGNLLSKT